MTMSWACEKEVTVESLKMETEELMKEKKKKPY